MALFDNLSELVLFFVLTALIWGDWYAPTVSMWSDYELFKKWHLRASKYMWLPPTLVFPLFCVLIYVLMEVAFYSFFKSAFQNTSAPAELIPAVAFLFVFNLCCTKQWIAVYMVGRRTYLAFGLMLGMGATAIVLVALFGFYKRWLELGTYAPYLLWWLGALYLTVRTWCVEKREETVKQVK